MEALKQPPKRRQQSWDNRVTGTGAICAPLHLRKPTPSCAQSARYSPAASHSGTGRTPGSGVCGVEVGALRNPKKEVRRGHTCHGWVPTAEAQNARGEH